MGSGIVLAMMCGFGQMHMLDAYGNSSCVQAETQQERKVESTVGECPTGMMKLLTQAGPVCVDKDVGKAYYQMKGMCPNGSYRGLDRWGNETCIK